MTFPFGFLGYDGIRRHDSIGRVILGLGHFDHTDEIVHLALEVFVRPLCGTAVRIALLAVSGIKLLLRQALRFGRLLAQLTLAAGLRKVVVIRNQAAGILAIDGVAAHRNTPQESAAEAVHYLLPVDVLVGEEPVEHIHLTGEYLTENATGEVETIFDGKSPSACG